MAPDDQVGCEGLGSDLMPQGRPMTVDDVVEGPAPRGSPECGQQIPSAKSQSVRKLEEQFLRAGPTFAIQSPFPPKVLPAAVVHLLPNGDPNHH